MILNKACISFSELVLTSYYLARGRGFTNAANPESYSHIRRLYADRARTGMSTAATANHDLSNTRYGNAIPPVSMLPPNAATTTDSQAPKSLPVSRNRTAGSFTKQTIK